MAGVPAAQRAEPAPPTLGRGRGPHSPARAAAGACRSSRFPCAPASPSPPKQLCGDPGGPRPSRRRVRPTQRRVSTEGPGRAVRAAGKGPGSAGRPRPPRASVSPEERMAAGPKATPPPRPPASSPEVGGPRSRPLRDVTATSARVGSSWGGRGESPPRPPAPGGARVPSAVTPGSRETPWRGAGNQT